MSRGGDTENTRPKGLSLSRVCDPHHIKTPCWQKPALRGLLSHSHPLPGVLTPDNPHEGLCVDARGVYEALWWAVRVQ